MRWTTVTSPIGELKLATDGTALTGLLFAGDPDPRGERDDAHPVLTETARQLGEYFDGTRTEFEMPLALAGADFERRVWTELLAIPYGHTATYAEIAARVGQPRAARAVGMANSLNPIAVIVPCHRVVGSNGSLTGYAAGTDVKSRLLELEAGVRMRAEFKAA
ncbi:methylated-DNA--[protein]-cysteine S-methyltransferase [Phytomonospora endophytica]|uniref:Methylated-DNA--protein-cysteine methyltransferase n=1 Tax=Phytomonospora endophytica TaxID=714109 RepID=A0A841FUQ7_9ACTN|nr:methylated-DNA--[protein]-cysteine S-methyltransferase [Phytomonospora endophytica]MBB6038493.1 methylated-DNA-[protein]-cysteine S-methyltransferase [Phytomonospora endophytica]GIG64423.1 methylated-DNA--protein-cysteine methyltransferase [Phytomonospora endophytica]